MHHGNMYTVIGSTIVNTIEHRGLPKAGFYASNNNIHHLCGMSVSGMLKKLSTDNRGDPIIVSDGPENAFMLWILLYNNLNFHA